MFDPLLTPPEVPDDQRGQGDFILRYDDLDQDGRLQCAAAAHSLGPAVWRTVLAKHPLGLWSRKNAVLPILSRLLVERVDGPLSVRNPLTGHGTLDLAHVPGEAPGSVDRIILSMWVALDGPIGETNLPPPPDAGRVVRAANVYAEHVLNAYFAPPGERKVRKLGMPGHPEVPPRVYVAPPLERYAEPPDGATPFGERARQASFLFGLTHTDANRHVNSLVYPLLFEEAALRHLATLGETKPMLARTLELGFRRPFFAGDRTILSLQAYRQGDTVGVCGAFFPDVADPEKAKKASTWARMTF